MIVERAVILSRDGFLANPLHKRKPEFMAPPHRPGAFQSRRFEDTDPALVVEKIEQAGWVIGGPRGAAAKLGLKRTTLPAKMKKLGIARPIPTAEDTLRANVRE